MTKKIKIPTYLESIANEVLSKYKRLDSILSHAPSKGSYHEKILRDIIKSYLPSSFSVGEGFIINKESKVSSQLDILIVDNLDPRSFPYKDNDFFIAQNIAVTCFGEVKTHCTRKEFIDSFQKLVNNSLIIGDDEGHAGRTTSFLFCYDAYASTETFKNWPDIAINKIKDKPKNIWNYPDYIFCLKKKVFFERQPVSNGFQYINVTTKNKSNTIIEQMIIQNIFQCVTNGCSRIRLQQGIKLFK